VRLEVVAQEIRGDARGKGIDAAPKRKPWKAGIISFGAQSQPRRKPAPRIFDTVPARITRPPVSSAYSEGR
jgi:hypothetical protein